jgi:hypothetical protein
MKVGIVSFLCIGEALRADRVDRADFLGAITNETSCNWRLKILPLSIDL